MKTKSSTAEEVVKNLVPVLTVRPNNYLMSKINRKKITKHEKRKNREMMKVLVKSSRIIIYILISKILSGPIMKFKMSEIITLSIIGSALLFAIIPTINVWAAVVNCHASTPCEGTSRNDQLNGDTLANRMWGLKGSDIIKGDDGDDRGFGGKGDDKLNGGRGIDTLSGGAGADKICGGEGNDKLVGKNGDDTIYGDSAPSVDVPDCTAATAGLDSLYGSKGNDALYGGPNNDVLWGGAGADSLNGDDGVDGLVGGAGVDTIHGGPGDDFLFAGKSKWMTNHWEVVIQGDPSDVLKGDAGRDTYDCDGAPASVAVGFNPAEDAPLVNCT